MNVFLSGGLASAQRAFIQTSREKVRKKRDAAIELYFPVAFDWQARIGMVIKKTQWSNSAIRFTVFSRLQVALYYEFNDVL